MFKKIISIISKILNTNNSPNLFIKNKEINLIIKKEKFNKSKQKKNFVLFFFLIS